MDPNSPLGQALGGKNSSTLAESNQHDLNVQAAGYNNMMQNAAYYEDQRARMYEGSGGWGLERGLMGDGMGGGGGSSKLGTSDWGIGGGSFGNDSASGQFRY